MKNFKITNYFVSEYIKPIDTYSPNHTNLLKKVLRIDNEGNEVSTSLQRDGKKGYNLKGVEKYNIIKAVRYDKVNKTSQQTYYIVMNLTPDCLTLDEGHKNYRDAKNAQEEILGAEEIEEREKISNLFEELENTVGTEREAEQLQAEQNRIERLENVEPLPKPTEDDKKLLSTVFNGFNFHEMTLFSKCLMYILIGRDLEKHPLNFNKSKDYGRLCKQIYMHYEIYPEGYWNIKGYDGWKNFMTKIRNFDKTNLSLIAHAIKNSPEFKKFESKTIKKYYDANPLHPLNPNRKSDCEVVDTDEALAYIE